MQVYVNDTLFMNDPLVDGGSVDAFYASSNSSSVAFSSGGSYVPTNQYAALRNGAQYGEQSAARSTSDAVSSSASQVVGRLVRGSESIMLHPKTTTTLTLHDPTIQLINDTRTSVPIEDRSGQLMGIKSDKQYDRDYITPKVKRAHSENVSKVLEQQRFRLIVGYTVINQDPKLVFEDFLLKPRNPVFTTGW
jgi:hypothetical protein